MHTFTTVTAVLSIILILVSAIWLNLSLDGLDTSLVSVVVWLLLILFGIVILMTVPTNLVLDKTDIEDLANTELTVENLKLSDESTLSVTYNLSDQYEPDFTIENYTDIEGLKGLFDTIYRPNSAYDKFKITIKEKDLGFIDCVKITLDSNRTYNNIYTAKVDIIDNTGTLSLDGKLTTEIKNGVTYYNINNYTLVTDSDSQLAQLVSENNVHLDIDYDTSTAKQNTINDFKVVNAVVTTL